MILNICPKNSLLLIPNNCDRSDCPFYFNSFLKSCILIHKHYYFPHRENIPYNLISIKTNILSVINLHKLSRVVLNLLKLTALLKETLENNITFCGCFSIIGKEKCVCDNIKLKKKRLKLQTRWIKTLSVRKTISLSELASNTDNLFYIRTLLAQLQYKYLTLSMLPIGYILNNIKDKTNISQVLGLHSITLQKIKNKMGGLMDNTLNTFVTAFKSVTYEIAEIYESGITIKIILKTKEDKILEYTDVISHFSELSRLLENKINKTIKEITMNEQNSVAQAQLERAKLREQKNKTTPENLPEKVNMYDRESLTMLQKSLGERKKRVFKVEE